MSIAIGKSKFGGGRQDFKVKKDEPITARIIPPIGDLAAKGKWAVYHAVEWGYKTSDGRMKPFLDVHVINRKTKMVEVQSAAYTRRDALKKEQERITALFKAGKATEDEKKKISDLVRQYNLDKKFYLNVKTLDGKLGTLKINYKMYQALKVEIDKMVANGIDPTSVDNGRFFTFSSSNATGNLPDWIFTVNEYKEQIDHPELGLVEKPVVDILTPDVINRLGDECSELDKLFTTVTAKDVERFVSEGALAVDEVLGKPAASAQPAADQPVQNSAELAAQAAVQQSVAVETPVAETTSALDPALAAAMSDAPAPVTETPVAQETAITEPETVAETTQTAPVAETTQTDEEYLKSIGAL